MSHSPLPIFTALLSLSSVCIAQTTFPTNPTRLLVCDKGAGHFQGKLPDGAANTGVSIFVGAVKEPNGFAARACQAKLTWGHDDLVVALQAAQADIDVMGADLGLGSLVVAFQIKPSGTDPHIRYEIYSLAKPPRLLRTITGEDFFNAADTLLDGSIEIWTTDTEAINGFEGIPAFEVPPTVVLRFEKKKLVDVSSEFRPYFDRQIAALRAELTPQQIADFRRSDGKLSSEPPDEEKATWLVVTKHKVLEIVWAYLYSGREQQARDMLAEMWPSSDLDRITAAILAAQKRGLRAQVDDVSHANLPFRQTHTAEIYQGVGEGREVGSQGSRLDDLWKVRSQHADTAPIQIVLKVPPTPDGKPWAEGKQMELVIDEAGKVRSARILDNNSVPQPSDSDWLAAAAGWKYIPAYKLGHPKSFRQTLFVSRDQ